MSVWRIPLDDLGLDTIISIDINVDGRLFRASLRFVWRRATKLWEMSVSDRDGNSICGPIPLVYNGGMNQNLLKQFRHLGIGSAYIIPSVERPSTPNPTATTIKSEWSLFWGDTDES